MPQEIPRHLSGMGVDDGQRRRGEADCIWEAGVEEAGSELVGRDNVVFGEELLAMVRCARYQGSKTE